jgi:pimeloyl-ACP methyl ester carboxylesterase/DNA-binding CsgD family transcriptional regulator
MTDIEGNDTMGVQLHDLDLVANSYRSMIDADSFDEMLVAWGRKLAHAGLNDESLNFSAGARSQLATVEAILRQNAVEPARDPMSAAISEFASAAIVMTPERRVMTMNDQGEAKFGGRRGSINSLNWLDPSSVYDFDAICKSAKDRGNRLHCIVRILSEDKPHGFSLAEVFVLKIPGHDHGYVIVRSLDLDWSPAVPLMLGSAFGLTDTEVEICRLLYLYSDADQIAKERGTSRLTVRTQIKSILAKTNTPNKVDLIRLLAVLCARQAKSGKVADWADPLQREQHLTLPNGGTVAWTWLGAQKGTPVLLVHGPSIGPYFSDKLDDWMNAANIRLIAVSRPGYGHSSSDISKSAIDEQISALRHLCTSLGLSGIVGVGIGCGIAPLLRMAVEADNPFSRLVHFGNFLPLNKERIKHHPKVQQTFFRLAKQAPWALEMVVKLGFRVMLQKGIDWYLERAYSESAIDLATCRNPQFAPFVRNGCAHMMHQGARAFSRDLALVWEPMDRWLKDLDIPLAWYVGEHHGGFVPEETAMIASVVSQLEFEIIQDAGELLIYQHPKIAADLIVKSTQEARVAAFV